MDTFSHFEIYIAAQKNVALQFMLIGGILLSAAACFHFFGKGDLSAGMRNGAAICGIFILVGGIAYLSTENKLLMSGKSSYEENQQEFQSQEKERMQKVIKDYPVYQFAFGGIIILSLLIVWFFDNPFWHGVSFSVILFSIGVMIIEAFSHQSIKPHTVIQ